MRYTSSMNRKETINNHLTFEDKLLKDIEGISLDVIDLGAPVELPTAKPEALMYRAKLSPATLKAEERRLARIEKKRKSLRNRKKYTRKPGHVHPKKKEATARRRREEKWATNPFFCVLKRNPYACKDIDKGLWEELIQPLWEEHNPADLDVVVYRRDVKGELVGTRANPVTVFTMDVVHKRTGKVLYKGTDMELYYLSM